MRYSVILATDTGRFIKPLDRVIREMRFSIVQHSIGTFYAALPVDTIGINELRVDLQVHVWRSPNDTGPLSLMRVYFLRRWKLATGPDGLAQLQIWGVCQNELLSRRIVAYPAGNAAADMTDQIDDMMKEIVRDNLGGDAITARDLVSKSVTNFTIAANSTNGVLATRGFAWMPMLDVLQQLARLSRRATVLNIQTSIYFDVIASSVDPNGVPTFKFQTFTGQPGDDRRDSIGNNDAVIFSEALGNVSEPEYEYDATGEQNYIYAGGTGTGASRTVNEKSDSAAIAASVWNRRERFANATSQSTSGGVDSKADEYLERGRPKEYFNALLLDTDASRFQSDWNWGDRVTVRAFGKTYEDIIRIVIVNWRQGGSEDITGRFDYAGSEPLIKLASLSRDTQRELAELSSK